MSSKWRKKLPEITKTRFSYFKEYGKNRAVIAAVEHNGLIYAAVAMCHPTDQFNKKIGKSISEGKVHKCIALGHPLPKEKTVVLPVDAFVKLLQELRSLEGSSSLASESEARPIGEKIVDIFGYEE